MARIVNLEKKGTKIQFIITSFFWLSIIDRNCTTIWEEGLKNAKDCNDGMRFHNHLTLSDG